MLSFLRLAEWSAWFWPAMLNHLWQSTLFAGVVFVLALLLRHAPARVRHLLWLLAVLKFVVPIAAVGTVLAPATRTSALRLLPGTSEGRLAVAQIAEPLAATSTPIAPAAGVIMLGLTAATIVWAAGAMLILGLWLRRAAAFRATLRAAPQGAERDQARLRHACARLGIRPRIALLTARSAASPSLWGVFRPVIVLPEAMAASMTDDELDSVLMHELVHAQRRDNLVSCVQMSICAVFWFYPLVWVLDRLLLAERELACDERVVTALGDPRTYASGLLKVVRFCLGWRLAGVSYAAHSNLRRRIERMTAGRLSYATRPHHRVLLAAAIAILVLGSFGTAALTGVPAAAAAAMQDQHELLGRYIVRNASFVSEFGLMSDDSTQLANVITGLRNAFPAVAGVKIRSVDGRELAQEGERLEGLAPSVVDVPQATVSATTRNGRAVLLFREPVPARQFINGGTLGDIELLLDTTATSAAEAFDARGRFIAKDFAYVAETALRLPSTPLLDQLVQRVVTATADLVGLAVVDTSGKVLASSGETIPALRPDAPLDGAEPGVTASGREVRVFRATIVSTLDGRRPDGTDPPAAEVRVALAAPRGR